MLLKRLLEEEKTGSIFGIPRELFFKSSSADLFRMERYGRILETPLGVAAGPHTQLTQNIISAWLTGARYIELKTIQTLDELTVSKPCIDMEDEGYNCEWSQELKIHQSFDQYLDAFILLYILKHKFGQPVTGDPGFIFNMSVGYNMEGILKENVQWFLDKMENCAAEKNEKLEKLSTIYPEIKNIVIPDHISNNVTISTMHGCPPEEIEIIAKYFIEKRKYHTTVKLNPTLLGPDRLREILNKKLGYDTIVPDEAFGHDLKYNDGVNLIRSLRLSAAQSAVDFSLKLTNTLESENIREVFSRKEKMNYMSGRALHPISVNLAATLQDTFDGQLDISFSAGIDAFNISNVLACGLKPVTVCSDILKPGGYGRLVQYLENLSHEMISLNANTLDTFILARAGQTEGDVKAAAWKNLSAYAQDVLREERNPFHKDYFPGSSIKTQRPLTFFDCIQAPCSQTCPAHQDVPQYISLCANGEYEKAFQVILNTNPFPTVTGMVCDHTCMTKCTRQNIDNSLQIRAIKRFITQQIPSEPLLTPEPSNGKTVCIIGAGPSGLSCAFYLALRGFQVHIYETQDVPGGMVSQVIPSFRVNEEDIRKDIERITRLGVTIYYNRKIDTPLFQSFCQLYNYIYIAVGATRSTRMKIKGEDSPYVLDALSFLSAIEKGREQVTKSFGKSRNPFSKGFLAAGGTESAVLDERGQANLKGDRQIQENEKGTGKKFDLGKKIAIVGGGNSAMDAARTAWRLLGSSEDNSQPVEVTLLYRRTQKEMPADRDEIRAIQEEGIRIMELTNPVEIVEVNDKEGRLKVHCWKMELGNIDRSGRPRPVKVEGADFDLYFDTLIYAIGQQVDVDFVDQSLRPDLKTCKTSIDNVYIGGDALRGPLNIITAAADGKRVADVISFESGIGNESLPSHPLTFSPSSIAIDALPPSPFTIHPSQFTLLPSPSVSSVAARDAIPSVAKFIHPAKRMYGIHPVEIPVQERRNFEIVEKVLTSDEAKQEASRCLDCNSRCSVCVSVCPNRAMVEYNVKPFRYKLQKAVNAVREVVLEEDIVFDVGQVPQVYNIAEFCNHCGNCRTFCPTSGAPFEDKPRVCLTLEAFKAEENAYFIDQKNGKPLVKSKVNGRIETLTVFSREYLYETGMALVKIDKNDFRIKEVEFKSSTSCELRLMNAVTMSILERVVD